MTNRLVIHLPSSSITFDSDNIEKLNKLSDFCKKELNAYHATANINELTVDEINKETSDMLHSLIFELGLL